MEKNLTTGSVFKAILTFALPYLLSYFLQTLYGMADLYITGRFCGVDSITAVANGSQVMHMLTVIIVGLAMGSTVIIGHAVGAGNMRDAEAAIGNTVTLFMVGSVVLAAALVGQLRPAAVVCVDSLCSAEGQRLGRTVQFSDSGLYPAQADHTRHLTRDTLGVPVVAAGIPTLMQAQEGADLVVTPRALDSVIAHGAALLAGSVNRALQPRLTVQQLCWLTG